jgi:copper resistance protein B
MSSWRLLPSALLLASTLARGAEAPRTPIPPLTDADRAAAVMPGGGHEFHDNDIHTYLLLNRLEYRNGDQNGFAWEAKGWAGTDLNRLWLRSEGARAGGEFEAADAEVFYGRSITTWWDLLGGVRRDIKPGSGRTWAALGIQGLAPQRFEIAATGYVGNGRTAARFESEYELLLTNRLILQPLLDLWAYGKDDAARGIGSGLSTGEFGLRLRYEFTRQFAPYAGIEWEHAFGNTADQRRAGGQSATETRFVLGLRTWF